MGKIAIWGDSITYGSNDFEKGGWVNRLKVSLITRDKDARVYNVGISGDRSYDLIDRFDIECEKRDPDIILFAIGTNDSQYTLGDHNDTSTSLEKYRDNLQWLIDHARKHSNQVGLLGLLKVDDSKVASGERGRCYNNENIKKYDTVVRDICRINRLPYLYMFDLLDESDLADGLHPSPIGHEKMFLRIKEFIRNNFNITPQ